MAETQLFGKASTKNTGEGEERLQRLYSVEEVKAFCDKEDVPYQVVGTWVWGDGRKLSDEQKARMVRVGFKASQHPERAGLYFHKCAQSSVEGTFGVSLFDDDSADTDVPR